MMSPELIVSSLARSTAGVFHTPPRARQLARRRLEPRGRESRATANASRGTQALSRARRDGRVPEIERSSTRIESLSRARANSTTNSFHGVNQQASPRGRPLSLIHI